MRNSPPSRSSAAWRTSETWAPSIGRPSPASPARTFRPSAEIATMSDTRTRGTSGSIGGHSFGLVVGNTRRGHRTQWQTRRAGFGASRSRRVEARLARHGRSGVQADVGALLQDADGELQPAVDLERLALTERHELVAARQLGLPGSAGQDHPLARGNVERPLAHLHDAGRELALGVLELQAADLSVEVLIRCDHVFSSSRESVGSDVDARSRGPLTSMSGGVNVH